MAGIISGIIATAFPSALPLGGDIEATSIYALMAKNAKNTPESSPTTGGSLTINGESLSFYDYTIKKGNQVISSFNNADWVTASQDNRSALICVDGDLTINSGTTFIPSNRKLFTCLYVTGNLVVNGQISMTARGANHSGDANSGGYVAPANIRIANGTLGSVLNPHVPAAGGSGFIFTATRSSGQAGNSGANGGTGSGGAGSKGAGPFSTGPSGGTAFSGGTGGGGAYGGGPPPNGGTTGTDSVFAGKPNGGSGGIGGDSNSTVTSGGGAGNPGGSPWTEGGSGSQAGQSGTGGTLIIIVEGAISGSGAISSNGSQGGNAVWSPIGQSNWLNGGGGSGGGSVTVLARTNSFVGTIEAVGGLGGSANASANDFAGSGGKGGDGTARILALAGNPF